PKKTTKKLVNPITMEKEYCMPEDFTNVAIPFRLLYGDNHCAMKCLQYPFCAGYNFKKKHQKKTPNCQLTHTLDHNFHDCNADDKGWIFYHPIAPRKQQVKNRCPPEPATQQDMLLKSFNTTKVYHIHCVNFLQCECPKDTVEISAKLQFCCLCYSTLSNLLFCCTSLERHIREAVPTLSDSVILSGEPADFLTRLTSWTGKSSTNWKLCWRATLHGWAASTFHLKCDNKKPTVTIIKVGNFIFGGYATESWEGLYKNR
ncbi:Hypothetical predicted protein, partial [Paramuricea clavata]